ncbi:MAG: bifunctional (p)ppGpp synthetase/guanosine-3',5'-bis(diphosphate) 3'-pyrophosphohydrolase [Clostridiales bacterium]|nr:bifunctional (p)ppGpp synthetase/guanosine-3',5'-bis(diphosphate) 3'-pyrophosphohydrolase [Clostridiales bacterium]
MVDAEKFFRELMEAVKEIFTPSDLEKIERAYRFAASKHEGQLRRDGSAFVTHGLATAKIIVEMGLDVDSIIAAILHDCIEDTGTTHEEIAKAFGKPVAELVDGVTKLSRVPYSSVEEEQVENLRKMLLAMAKDIRVILIKLADRLHNMRTMEYQTEQKQRTKSLETMEIYAPIAHRLGMQKIKWELEDISLRYLDPYGYKEILDELQSRSTLNDRFIETNCSRIENRLKEADIAATVYGRTKHIYSIYRKVYSKDKGLGEVYDLYAFRVIVDTIADCYNVLGQIHDLFKPVPGRFKDYIGTPKPNLYQSLHTTVIGREGIPFEVQIRTWDMHLTAEYGIAAHWKYKQGVQGKQSEEEKLGWIRRLLENQQEMDPEDFISTLKTDMFSDEVFVFTPKGDVINLPAGATPIDFAYAIHSAVGNSMTGVKVNSRISNYDYVLQNGDVVEVITSKSSKGPSRDWIKLARSNEARTKIRQWFKRERQEENIANGRQSLEAELKKNNIPLSSVMGEEILPVILQKLHVSSLNELYASIGYGGTTAVKVVNRVKLELMRLSKEQRDKLSLERLTQEAKKPKRSETGLIVENIENCLTKFSHCCTPVPGDPVIGFITRGFGVSVHRQDCRNVLRAKEKESDEGRWVKVSWTDQQDALYEARLALSSHDRDNFVVDIVTALSALKVKVQSLNARALPDGYAVVDMTVFVKNKAQLTEVMNRINGISGVIDVKRANG